MRILVTGSRNWDDARTIVDALLAETRGIVEQEVTVIHGDCPTGADHQADSIAENFDWNVERHPADWNRYGRSAGYVRNADMVKLGADVCLAFIKNNSKGATMCSDLAEKAGIPVKRFPK